MQSLLKVKYQNFKYSLKISEIFNCVNVISLSAIDLNHYIKSINLICDIKQENFLLQWH